MRRRFAPAICELRGERFVLRQTFYAQGIDTPQVNEISRKLYCTQAGTFGKVRQYSRERHSLAIQISADLQTAQIEATYTEKMPFYPDGMPLGSPDNYTEMQILESTETSVLAIENGAIVYWSTDAETEQTLVPKHTVPLPYD